MRSPSSTTSTLVMTTASAVASEVVAMMFLRCCGVCEEREDKKSKVRGETERLDSRILSSEAAGFHFSPFQTLDAFMPLVDCPLRLLGSHPAESDSLCALAQLRVLKQDLSITARVASPLDLPGHHRTLNVALLSVWFT
jgi:hypothetical protein